MENNFNTPNPPTIEFWTPERMEFVEKTARILEEIDNKKPGEIEKNIPEEIVEAYKNLLEDRSALIAGENLLITANTILKEEAKAYIDKIATGQDKVELMNIFNHLTEKYTSTGEDLTGNVSDEFARYVKEYDLDFLLDKILKYQKNIEESKKELEKLKDKQLIRFRTLKTIAKDYHRAKIEGIPPHQTVRKRFVEGIDRLIANNSY